MWFASSSPASARASCALQNALSDRSGHSARSMHYTFPMYYINSKRSTLIRISRFLLCQWRNLNRMIHDKCRLDQLFLTKLIKEQVEDITLLMVLFIFNMMLVCKLLAASSSANFIKVNTCIFLDCIDSWTDVRMALPDRSLFRCRKSYWNRTTFSAR